VIKVDVWSYALLTIVVALIVGLLILNPLWARHSPPFEIPKVLPAITAPVDGPFYLWNADYGYRWHTGDPLSLWFHPLMSCIVRAMPKWLPSNIRFWVTSIAFAVGSLILTYQLTSVLINNEVPAGLLPLTLLAPGGLEIATGNAEIPTLCFTLALQLSVLRWQKWWLTGLCAVFSVLAKPNGLYMVPVLLTYLVSGCLEKDTRLWRQALTGIAALLVTWVLWIVVVDLQAGRVGTYWNLRMSSRQYVAGDAWSFFDQLARSFLYDNDIRERIRYSTALIIPIANLWIIGFIPLSHERHRYAMAAGNLAMLAIALYLGNPNKIIVYTTTLPGHFVAHITLVKQLTKKAFLPSHLFRFVIVAVYAAYCAGMLAVYVLGTPLGWYY